MQLIILRCSYWALVTHQNQKKMNTNKEIKAMARQELKNYWSMPALAVLVYALICGVIGFGNSGPLMTKFPILSFSSILLSILISLPLGYGFKLAFYDFVNGGDKENTVEDIFQGFKNYGRAIGLSLLQNILIFLFTLLLIIPGIIKAYAYALAFYVSKDNPLASASECLDISQEMMKGHKMDLFLLDLSFIGWAFLCILTLGIGFFWLVPYMEVSHAKFYQALKTENPLESIVTSSTQQ